MGANQVCQVSCGDTRRYLDMCTSYVDQNSCDSECTSVKYYVIDNGEFVCKQNSTYAFRTGLQNSACPPGFSINATG